MNLCTNNQHMSQEISPCPFLTPKTYIYSNYERNRFEAYQQGLLKETDIPNEERSILLDFSNMLGTCDTDGQLSGIAACRELMQERYYYRSSEYNTKAKLFRSLGVLAGVMVGIIVI